MPESWGAFASPSPGKSSVGRLPLLWAPPPWRSLSRRSAAHPDGTSVYCRRVREGALTHWRSVYVDRAAEGLGRPADESRASSSALPSPRRSGALLAASAAALA